MNFFSRAVVHTNCCICFTVLCLNPRNSEQAGAPVTRWEMYFDSNPFSTLYTGTQSSLCCKRDMLPLHPLLSLPITERSILLGHFVRRALQSAGLRPETQLKEESIDCRKCGLCVSGVAIFFPYMQTWWYSTRLLKSSIGQVNVFKEKKEKVFRKSVKILKNSLQLGEQSSP